MSRDIERFMLGNNDVAYTSEDFNEGSTVAVVEARGTMYKVIKGTLESDLNENGFLLVDEEMVADFVERKREAKQQAKNAVKGGQND